jgi:hypothetical protein
MDFCPSCGRMVESNQAYCQNCGAPLSLHNSYSSRTPFQTIDTNSYRMGKNPWLATALAVGLGIFGLWGVGHLYAGRIARGFGLFVVGLIVGGLFWASVILTFFYIGFVGMILFGIVFLGGWLWQAFDAYNVTEEYNELYVVPRRNSW